MNREEYVEMLVREYMKIRKIDMENEYRLNMYPHEGEFIISMSNNAEVGNGWLFIYVKPYDDSEKDLKEHFELLTDFVDKRCAEIFEGENTVG
ncbi:MAG: hypothetical protein EOM07_12040 [Clostridia bacterium]|nr:hypothetical protein [Clostridia bacterium]